MAQEHLIPFQGVTCLAPDVDLPGVTPGNLNTAEYFAAAMAGLIGVYIILRWARYPSGGSQKSSLARILFAPSRVLRSLALRKVPGLPSAGHGLVVVIYIAINLALMVVQLDWPLPLLSTFARRLGWLAISNLALVFFLALKNTPLAYLTEYSYERLNVLHQVAGYAFVLLAVLHTLTFIVDRSQQGLLCNINDAPQHPSAAALALALVIVGTTLFLKSKRYELWYKIHVIFGLLVALLTALHRPILATYSVRVIFFIAAIYIADRAIRSFRLLYNRRNQTAMLSPLPSGGTMITLSRPVARAKAGKHVFLVINKISFLQSHPFTMVSANPVKFIINTHSGFTRALHERATAEPGLILPATLDGPYGTLPPFEKFDKVILIAGGAGASFTIAIATELIRRVKPGETTTIEFIWAVRDHAKIAWFNAELSTLTTSDLINVSIHVTSPAIASTSGKSDPDALKQEKFEPAFPAIAGRPNVAGIVGEVVKSAALSDRVIIAACGPQALMNAVRSSAAQNVRISGPSVELHIESFGW